MDAATVARRRMVEEQLARRRITDQRVLAAMERVPRHLFVPLEQRHLAYEDRALPIGNNQTISQPYIVALMAEALLLRGDEHVLEIGTGSGYAAAVLAELAAHVVTVERHAELAAQAVQTLAQSGYRSVEVVRSDGSLGWAAQAPYDAISVPAGAPQVPVALLDQLARAGRLVIPVGSQEEQRLLRVRHSQMGWQEDWLGPVRFVPLLGAGGWQEQAR